MKQKVDPSLARALVLGESFGILSTHSKEFEGYPFGSVTPYCTDDRGNPLIYVSTLAQHTKNIAGDAKVSLTIMQSPDGDVQAKGRATLLADASVYEDEDALQRYFSYFPASRQFEKTHDFSLYRLQVQQVRYIGGFGKIYWIEAKDYFHENPLFGAVERRIVEHMNEDHADALVKYCNNFKKMDISNGSKVIMAGIDSEGFDVLVEDDRVRFAFDTAVTTADLAREKLVAMARA